MPVKYYKSLPRKISYFILLHFIDHAKTIEYHVYYHDFSIYIPSSYFAVG